MKEKYPRLKDIPYYGTPVAEEKTKMDIVTLLNKYDIHDHQWTTIGGKENVKFIFDGIIQGVHTKIAVQFDIPDIKAISGRNQDVISVPRKQVYRILYYSLKSLLETTKYGFMTKEEIFFSYIMTQLPNGKKVRLKDLAIERGLLLPPGSDEGDIIVD